MLDCLIVIDRDGTLIEKHDYLGKSHNWKLKVSLIEKTVFLLKALDVVFPDNLKIVFTNQTGVALGYLTEQRVKEINAYVKILLQKEGVDIKHWIYSAEADAEYAEQKKIRKNKYVKTVSSRKPNPFLLKKKLESLGSNLLSINHKFVIGDSEDDGKLAENINAEFIEV